MKLLATAVLLACLLVPTGCSVVHQTSRYPAQYKAFRTTVNAACDELFYAMGAHDRAKLLDGIRRILRAKAPPDLQRRWTIFKTDIRHYFLSSDVVADRAAQALDDGAAELGLDKC